MLDLTFLDISNEIANDLWLSLHVLGAVATNLTSMRVGYEAGKCLFMESTIDDNMTVCIGSRTPTTVNS